MSYQLPYPTVEMQHSLHFNKTLWAAIWREAWHMVYRSLLCKSTCSDARSAVCCQGDYCTSCRGGAAARDSLRKPSLLAFLQFYFSRCDCSPCYSPWKPARDDSESRQALAGGHTQPRRGFFCQPLSNKWTLPLFSFLQMGVLKQQFSQK